MDYKATLNLPNTKFSMKADLPKKEPEILKVWERKNIYALIRESKRGRKKFILHDGPPYANGNIHMGHVLNKILKDIVVKFATIQGMDAPFVPGWDCHGLPVEHQLFKELKMTKSEISQLDFRKKAHNYAMKYVGIQRDEFKRLGVFGDWEKPYLTLDPYYEAAIIRSFGALVRKGYIFKDLKPVNWCTQCETALAEAEVEYEDRASPSIYVRFRLKDIEAFKKIANLKGEIYFLIWTTTPWTLLANVAIAVHPDMNYVAVNTKHGNLIIVESRLDYAMNEIGEKGYKILAKFKGRSLESLEALHPFIDRISKIVLADYVTIEEGTGCVHTAPGHGEADYVTGKKYNLPTLMPIDSKGRVERSGGEFKGLFVTEANPRIIKKLADSGDLLASGEITHSYPHCWRCKQPIIFRATEQYFMGVDIHNLRKVLLDVISGLKWYPETGMERISAMVRLRPDWCLSRQRYWGVPIPGFYCANCSKLLLSPEIIENVARIVEKEGSSAYFVRDASEFIPKGTKCPECKNSLFKKESDIIDVWFESGVSHQAVLKNAGAYPADLYLEGSDQHRGWFQSSLLTAVAIDGASPYRMVLTHGFVVDGEGKKMSKSLGNVISPQDVMKDYGADILRLWVASSDYSQDVRLSGEILSRLADSYRKIRNTLKYLLSNLYDFDPSEELNTDDLLEIDRWALQNTKRLLEKATESYKNFDFHIVYRSIYNFCTVFLSSIYLDILKDRMYTFVINSRERKSGQRAMYIIAVSLIKILAPILPFTAEEAWGNTRLLKSEPESVHLALWPDLSDFPIDQKIDDKYQKFIELREKILVLLENERIAKKIGSSLEAKIIFSIKNEDFEFFKNNEKNLPAIFIVSQVEVKKADGQKGQAEDIIVNVEKADGKKCQRCWNYSVNVNNDPQHPDVCERCSKILKAVSH